MPDADELRVVNLVVKRMCATILFMDSKDSKRRITVIQLPMSQKTRRAFHIATLPLSGDLGDLRVASFCSLS